MLAPHSKYQSHRAPIHILEEPTIQLETHVSSQTFAEWRKAERADGDTFGYCFMLIFHVVTLAKWRSFPASHILYFMCYIAATLAAFCWQRSGRPSYTAWREWIQAAVRLECYFSPVRISLWQKSVQALPPTTPASLAHTFPMLSPMLAMPVFMANTMVMNLLLLPLVHTLSLWPHLAVQLVCVGWVMYLARSLQGCSTPFFRHPVSRCLLGQTYEWLQLLTLPSFSPLTSHTGSRFSPQVCGLVVRWLQLVLGLMVPVAVQAWMDARAYRQWRGLRRQALLSRQRGGVTGDGDVRGGSGTGSQGQQQTESGESTLAEGSLGVRLALCVEHLSLQPIVWLLLGAAVWDVLGLLLR